MDIFHTESSLGAGALGIKQERKISPLADADKTTFEDLYEGPLRAA